MVSVEKVKVVKTIKYISQKRKQTAEELLLKTLLVYRIIIAKITEMLSSLQAEINLTLRGTDNSKVMGGFEDIELILSYNV